MLGKKLRHVSGRAGSPRAEGRLVNQWIWRVMRLLALRQALIFTIAWAFAWGVAALIARVMGVDRLSLLWGLIGLAGVLPAAAIFAWRRRPSHTTARATLDAHNRCGGLLMVDGEDAMENWRTRLPALRAPAIQWRSQRLWAILAAAGVFVLAGMTIPVHRHAAAATAPLDITGPASRLTAQINTLKHEKIIKQDTAAAMKKQLSQVRADARANQPARTWEALDHLTSQARAKAQAAGEKAIEQISKLARAQSLNQALNQPGNHLSAAQRAAAMSSLAQDMRQAAAQNAEVARDLSPSLQKALQSGHLTAAQRAQLAKALGNAKASLAGKLARLNHAGLLDRHDLRLAQRAGATHGGALAKYLAQHPGDSNVDNALALASIPGRGGVNRGGGPVPMTFNLKQPSDKGIKFAPQILPPAAAKALRQSKIIAVTARAPQVDHKAVASTGGALTNAAAGGGSAAQQTVLPRYRAAVRKYFQRSEK